jgi:hypothetical protein
MIGAAAYLYVAVFKAPFLVILLVGLVCSLRAVGFLVFIGEMSYGREGRRYE